METRQEWKTYLNAATSLEELRDRLNEMSDWAVSGDCDYEESDRRVNLEKSVDTTDLPTFGGLEPSDTHGIYSWNETSYLVPDNDRGWELVARS